VASALFKDGLPGRSQNPCPSVHAITALLYLTVATCARFSNYEKFEHSTNSWKADVTYVICIHLPAFVVVWNTLKTFQARGLFLYPRLPGVSTYPMRLRVVCCSFKYMDIGSKILSLFPGKGNTKPISTDAEIIVKQQRCRIR